MRGLESGDFSGQLWCSCVNADLTKQRRYTLVERTISRGPCAAPMKVRQDRLGHADPRTTMGYTHVIGDDHRKVAEQLGGFFAQVRLNLPKKESGSGDLDSQAAV